jgi:hypothetical protein
MRPLFFLECVFFPVKLGTPMKPVFQAMRTENLIAGSRAAEWLVQG